MKKVTLVLVVVTILLVSGCTKVGQGVQPISSDLEESSVREAGVPTQVVTKIQPAVSSISSTSEPSVASTNSSAGQPSFYVTAEYPASLTPKEKISERWSDGKALPALKSKGVLSGIVPSEASHQQEFEATIWVAQMGLCLYGNCSKEIDAVTGVIPLPPDARSAQSWAVVMYKVLLTDPKVGPSDELKSSLKLAGMTIDDFYKCPWVTRIRGKIDTGDYNLNSLVPEIKELAGG